MCVCVSVSEGGAHSPLHVYEYTNGAHLSSPLALPLSHSHRLSAIKAVTTRVTISVCNQSCHNSRHYQTLSAIKAVTTSVTIKSGTTHVTTIATPTFACISACTILPNVHLCLRKNAYKRKSADMRKPETPESMSTCGQMMMFMSLAQKRTHIQRISKQLDITKPWKRHVIYTNPT